MSSQTSASHQPPKPAAQNRQQHYISKDASVIAGPDKHEITLGQGCVLHPFATIDATHGPVHIGDYCIIEEGAMLVVAPPTASPSPEDAAGGRVPLGKMTIGSYNRFGPRCRIESSSIGSGNTFYARSTAGMMSIIGDHCVLAATTRVTHDAVLPSNTRVIAASGEGGGGTGGAAMWISRSDEVDVQGERDECLRLSRYFRTGQFV